MAKIPVPATRTVIATGAGVPRVDETAYTAVPNAIAGVAATVTEFAQQEVRQQDMARASEKLAAAQLAWTKQEMERQRTFDPANEESYSERVMSEYDSFRSDVSSSATGRLEARLLDQWLTDRRPTVGVKALQFESAARADYRRQVLGTTLEQRAAAAALDPSQALELIARQGAEVRVNGSYQLSPAERSQLEAHSTATIALAAANTIADTDPGALPTHPVFSMIPASQLPGLLKRVHQSQVMSKAQTNADAIMARGVPLDEAMRSIERDFNGEEERTLKAEVASRYSYTEAARKDREQEAYGTALLEVEQRGRVTPATWGKLTDANRAAVLNRVQAEAKQRSAEAAGRPVKTDFSLYLDLRQKAMENPQEFGKLDLKQYVDRIGGAQLEQLLDLKGKIMNPLAPKALRETVTLTQQMNATMQALNIRKPEQKGKFLSFVQEAVDEETRSNGGKPLNFEQRQKVIDRAVLQGPDPDAWLWGEKRMFELTPDARTRFKPNAASDAPATEIDALNDALKAQGIPQTPANRMALYSRASRAAQ